MFVLYATMYSLMMGQKGPKHAVYKFKHCTSNKVCALVCFPITFPLNSTIPPFYIVNMKIHTH